MFKNTKQNSLNKIKIKKTGENITEKVYQTRNNKLINERRTVEVFQVNKSLEKVSIENEPKVENIIEQNNGLNIISLKKILYK